MTLSELIKTLQDYPNPEQEFSIICMLKDECIELEYLKVVSLDKGTESEIEVAIMAHPIGVGTMRKLQKEELH